jgi:Transport and Golgi organisation 2
MLVLPIRILILSSIATRSWQEALFRHDGGSAAILQSQGGTDCGTMCLVFIAYQIEGCVPVMIGANREESRRRPVTSPVCCRVRSLRCLLAGADHGPDGSFPHMGTWLGVNEAGIAVAVTNRHDGELAWEDQTRSKGLLAVDLLGFDDPAQASQYARAELARGGFGGCNYLIAGAGAAFVVQAPGASRVAVAELPPGIHAMTNLDLDAADDPRIQFVTSNLVPRDFLTSARRICRNDRIVIPGADRGTISSSVILVDEPIALDHILVDPRDRDAQQFRLTNRPRR